MDLPPINPINPIPAMPRADSRHRARVTLGRRVSAVTQVSSLVALTSTGALVGWFGHQAQAADALKAQRSQAESAPVVVAVPVRRHVTTVVVRRTAPALAPRPAAVRLRTSSKATRRTTTRTTTTTMKASAPRPTPKPAATSTSGS